MVVNRDIVIKVYQSILEGTLSYASADRWAWNLMQESDKGSLLFEPPDDEGMLWELIQYLYGIDVPDVDDRNLTARDNTDLIRFLKSKGIDLS